LTVRSPERNEYIAPPGWVTMTSGLEELPGRTAAITPVYDVMEYRAAGDLVP
jgi:hypothetical protein